MYIPPAHKVIDLSEIAQFIKTHNFGTLISTAEGKYTATHLPFLLHESNPDAHYLTGHMAKANTHWKALNGQEVLVIFQGPHAYIPSTWYPPEKIHHPAVAVPTWNYTAVHLYGTFHIIWDEKELREQMQEQVRFYEPTSILLENERIYEHLLKAIVHFRIDATHIEAKYKINQKEDAFTRQNIIEALKSTKDCNDRVLAEFMINYYKAD